MTWPKYFQYTFSIYFRLQCQVTVCLTDLLLNYAANEWPRYQEVGSSGGMTNDNSRYGLRSNVSPVLLFDPFKNNRNQKGLRAIF